MASATNAEQRGQITLHAPHPRTSQPPPSAIARNRTVASQDRPQHPTGALGGEIQRHAEAEEAVGRADPMQVDAAGGDHRGVAGETG